MSHEIRTPLNAILGYGEILQFEARKLGLSDFIEDLRAIEFAGRHLLSLINEILELSKIQAGKMEIYPESFDLSNLIEEVVRTVKPLALKKKNKLEVIKQGLPDSMFSDSSRIRQILLNLLGNSCKFTEAGEIYLTVTGKTVDGIKWVYFTIGDTGIGIAPDKIPKLFEEFVQVDSSTTRKHGGTGLGLTISKRLAMLLGGDIQASSELGKGASFTVSIPEDVSEVSTFEKETVSKWTEWESQFLGGEKDIAPDGNQKMLSESDFPINRILVICEDDVICNLIKKFMEKEGCKVDTTNDGEQGLSLAGQNHPELIILDDIVKTLDGCDVLPQIRQTSGLENSPVILLSGGYEGSKVKGATETLLKPLDWDHFVSVFKKYRIKPTDFSILVIEDDSINREALVRILNKSGWNVLEAIDGSSAFKVLNKETIPDMILLDLVLPEMNGFEFITRLRQNLDWKDIPIIVNSAKELTLEERVRLQGDVVKILKKGDVTCGELLEEVRKVSSRAGNGKS